MKNKKAAIFDLFLMIIGVSALLTAYFFIGLNTEQLHVSIGTQALEVAEMSQEAEKVLLYADQSAKNSAWLTIWEMADTGGFEKLNQPYNSYSLWNLENPSLYPSYYKQTFINKITINLNKFLKHYEKQKEVELSDISTVYLDLQEKKQIINYDLFTKDTNLIGSPHYPLTVVGVRGVKIGDYLPIQGQIQRYSVYPGFNVDIKYDIDEYQTLITQANHLITKCSGSNETFACITKEKPANWNIGDCRGNIINQNSTIFRFCANSKYKIPHFETTLKIEQLKYKFALDFIKN